VKVDLYTDAGVDQRTFAAQWATVAIVEGVAEPIEAFGRLRADTNCSATAECRAIGNALYSLARAGHLPSGAIVRVYSDSRHAVDRIEGRLKGRPDSTMASAVSVIRAFVEKLGINLRAFWIPGHKDDSHSPHARWNNRCDALCRQARGLPRPSPARKALLAARRLEGRA